MKNEGRHDPQGNSVNALGPQVHLVDDSGRGEPPVGEETQAGNIHQGWAQITACQGQEPQNGQGQADASTGSFQDQEDGEIPDDQVPYVGKAGPEDELIEIKDDIAGKAEGKDGKGHLKVGNFLRIITKLFFPHEYLKGAPEHKQQGNDQAGVKKDAPEDEFPIGLIDIGLPVPGHNRSHIKEGRQTDQGSGQVQGVCYLWFPEVPRLHGKGHEKTAPESKGRSRGR